MSSSRVAKAACAVTLAAAVPACGSATQDVKTGAPSPEPAAAVASLSAPPTPPAFRLPTDAHPDRYDLDLWLDPEAVAFHGRIGIDLTVTRSTSVIWLNGTGLAVDSATFEQGGRSRAARVTVGGDDYLGFDLPEALPVGRARLTVVLPRQGRSREEPRDLRRQGAERRVVSVHLLREHRLAPGVPLVRRARVQGAVEADACTCPKGTRRRPTLPR